MWVIIFILIGLFLALCLFWKLISNWRNTPATTEPSENTPLLHHNLGEKKKSSSRLRDEIEQGDQVRMIFAMPDDIADLPSLKKQSEELFERKDEENELIDVVHQRREFRTTSVAQQADDVMSEEAIQFLLAAVKYSRLLSSIKDEDRLRDVVKTMTKINVKDGDVVIRQGDTNGRFYYVMESGAVDVFVFDQFRVTIQPGWCFGELSFVFGAPRSASCIASSDSKGASQTVLWVLDRAQFDRVMNGHAPLERMRITRQDSDPEEEEDDQEAEVTKRALQQLYGQDFFKDEGVRLLSKEFLEQLLERDYIGVPDQIEQALTQFQTLGVDLRYNMNTRAILPL